MRLLTISAMLMACAIAPVAVGQTAAGHWIEADPIDGLDGPVSAAAWWDPDGDGPLPRMLVLGGSMHAAGSVACSGLIAWNPQAGQWHDLGVGVFGPASSVQSLKVLSTGELAVGGSFTQVGTALGEAASPAGGFAILNGSSWRVIGSFTTDSIYYNAAIRAIEQLPDGRIVVGGEFSAVNESPIQAAASWDGSIWSPVLPSVTNGRVNVIKLLADGSLLLGGYFWTPGVQNGVIRVSPSGVVDSLGGGVLGEAFTAVQLPNGDLVVSGTFTLAGGGVAVNRIGRWDGREWWPMGSGFHLGEGETSYFSYAQSMNILPDGRLLATGRFVRAGLAAVNGFAAWNGQSWSAYPTPSMSVSNLSVPVLLPLGNNRYFVAGEFSGTPQSRVRRAAIFDGTSLVEPVVSDIRGAMNLCGVWNDGSPLGYFAGNNNAGSLRTILKARRSGQWVPVAADLTGTISRVAHTPDGSLIVAGSFDSAGGLPASNIARLDAQGWSSLGSGIALPSGTSVSLLAVRDNGNVCAGGTNVLKIWNGSAWLDRSSFAQGYLSTACYTPDGWLWAWGSFSNFPSGVSIGRWLGDAAWTPVSSAATISTAKFVPGLDGRPWSIGYNRLANTNSATPIAAWDGSDWVQVLPGAVGTGNCLAHMPGSAIFLGAFSTTSPTQYAAVWDGLAMNWLAEGLNGSVQEAFTLPNGDVCVSGNFTRAGPLAADGFAIWRPAPAPVFTLQATGGRMCRGSFSLRVEAVAEGELTFRWRRNGVPLSDGGTISGSRTPVLTLTYAAADAAGIYDCVASNGRATASQSAVIVACEADFTCDSFVDAFDYEAFVAAFEAGDANADMDHDGFLDGFDYEQFVTVFEQACN